MEQETASQEKKHQLNEFESWYKNIVWFDPYPDFEEVARLAWEASRTALNQPK